MFGMFGGFPGMGGGRFEAHYRCYPVTFIEKPEAERGDKVFLPPSALDRLAQLNIEYPMLFQIENRRDARSTHCGVLEFIADEGMIYMPYWMMQNLLLQEGDVVTLRSAALPKGTFVKLQPHSKDFLDISNPRAVLETTLRNFSCLTVGDTIPINYNNKRYFIDIIEAKPADAISVIETDCNVDFAPPLDYVEPERVFPGTKSGDTSMLASGSENVPMVTDSIDRNQGTLGAGLHQRQQQNAKEGEDATPAQPTFLAFAGTGRRLDGKAVSESKPVPIPLAGNGSRTNNTNNTSGDGSVPKSGSSAPGSRKAGKLMFKDRLAAKYGDKGKSAGGVNAAAAAAAEQRAKAKKEEEEEEKDGFQAFKGTGYKLK